MLMAWFDTNAGVKQGDNLLPKMYHIFINDIVDDVNTVNSSIESDGHNIYIHRCADDIVLLCEVMLKKDYNF